MCAQYVTNCYSKSKGKRLKKSEQRLLEGMFAEVDVAAIKDVLNLPEMVMEGPLDWAAVQNNISLWFLNLNHTSVIHNC